MVCIKNIRSSTNRYNTPFNVAGISKMKDIYCRCGCIIRLDSAEMKIKQKLGKELECTNCRNARISREIDELNSVFEPQTEEVF